MTQEKEIEKEKKNETKKKRKKANPNKKNTKGLYLAINIFAFLSCWAAAMGFMSWFDAPVLIFLLFSIVAGYLQGSIREIINILFGVLALVSAWLLAVLTVDSIHFGFFLPKIHYSYMVWFVIYTPIFFIVAKKIINFTVVKLRKLEIIKKADEKTGIITGCVKGVVICYIYITILFLSNIEEVSSVFQIQAESSVALKYFAQIENDYAVLSKIDTWKLRYNIIDMYMRWKFYYVAGEIYPGNYKAQRYLLDIVTPLIYNSKNFANFCNSANGKEIIAVLKSTESGKKAWQKDKHTRSTLQQEEHSSKEILIVLHQKFIQEALQASEILEFIKNK